MRDKIRIQKCFDVFLLLDGKVFDFTQYPLPKEELAATAVTPQVKTPAALKYTRRVATGQSKSFRKSAES